MRFLLLVIAFLGFSMPANATLTWASNLAKVLVEVSSSLSWKLFLILQDVLFPVFVVISLFWIVFLVISQFISEKPLTGSELAKELFKKGVMIGIVGSFFTMEPSWLFDLTITPLIDLALGYGAEIMGATDTAYSQCLNEINNTGSKGLFSAELQNRFICILDHLFQTLMFGVNMGLSLIISGIASIIFPPLMFLKLILGGIIMSSFANLMVDLLWRFVDTLFYFIIGAVLLPFTFIGWAFSEDKNQVMPYFSNWSKSAVDKFKQGAINLIFWCIAVAFIHFLLQEAFYSFGIKEGGEVITPEKLMNKQDPAFFNTDGTFKGSFLDRVSGSFLSNLKGWLILLVVGIFGKYLVKKIRC